MASEGVYHEERRERALGIATEALSRWRATIGGADAIATELLWDASNFIVRVQGKSDASLQWVLRIAGDNSKRTESHVSTELTLLAALREKREHAAAAAGEDVRFPTPIPADDGSLFVAARGRLCVLWEWIDGKWAEMTPDKVRAFGAAIARLHDAAIRLEHSGKLPAAGELPKLDDLFSISRPLEVVGVTGEDEDADVELVGEAKSDAEGRSVSQVRCSAAQAATLRAARAQAEDTLRLLYAADGEGRRVHVVHGDLHLANTLVTGDGHTYLIDFDGISLGFAEQDLAIFLWSLQFDGLDAIFAGELSPHFAARRESLLAGYTSIRPLPEASVRLIDTLKEHRDLVVLSWFATQKQFSAKTPGLGRTSISRMAKWLLKSEEA